MVPRPIEGVLMIAAVGNSATGPYQVMFAPYASRGGALEPRQLVDRAALDKILHELRVEEEEKQRAFTALQCSGKRNSVRRFGKPEKQRR